MVASPKFCPNCGEETKGSKNFCPSCGTPLNQTVVQTQPTQQVHHVQQVQQKPSVLGAFLLELILGMFGFMGFGWMYSGKTGVGILLLLGYWLFAGIYIFLVSIIGIATMGIGLAAYCCLPLVPCGSAILLALTMD